ncbi:ATP-binding protein [Streptomyces rhizosphaericola]|uniref:histidine kinase n=1 Tax=Streptomyces rhizosphaericola TaxID=2564098 RepID=A0ABY2PLQ7_9ACTN|nr:ATP-binding protein [Streptomyces rhizosphaericola]TGZ12034.1 sensor histidine kinase [Streptomyces rhizosphaericola]
MANFRTSARTVDMLGRQQIAGIPTAINELFKNSYDAYAKTVVVDWLKDRNVLILRDDGVGMSLNDFSERWLTIGTDSKASGGRLAPPPIPQGFVRRPVMGEKGIGRLAIAALGPLALILTRQRPQQLTEENPAPVIAALVPWTLFSTPGVTLEDIDVPVLSVDGSVDRSVIEYLTGKVRTNLLRISHRLDDATVIAIRDQLGKLELIDPSILKRLPGPHITSRAGFGTTFIVTPVDDSLQGEVEGDSVNKGQASRLFKLLAGFSNTMATDAREPEMRTSFVVRTDDGVATNILDGDEFFDRSDFKRADHEFSGTFDEYGTFHGQVSIYRADPIDHVIPWKAGRGAPTQCGPFRIHFGYVHASPSQSSLTPQEHAEISRKLQKIAGLYVYKDGIRMLPYGQSDVDYLQIEERRSRNQGYYFFSYRRMFGAIELSSTLNPALQEKAGREGFRENIAYRQMRKILENFLVQLAADFFRASSQQGQEFQTKRDELERTEKVRRARARTTDGQRDNFRIQLQRVIGDFSEARPVSLVEKTIIRVERELASISDAAPDALEAALELEEAARRDLESVIRHYTVHKPVGVGLDRETSRDWNLYEQLRKELVSSVVPGAAVRISEMTAHRASRLAPMARLHERIREDFEESAARELDDWSRDLNKIRARSEQIADDVSGRVRSAVQQSSDFARALTRRLTDLPSSSTEDDLFDLRRQLLEELEEELHRQKESLEPIRRFLAGFESVSGGLGLDEQLEAVEEEVIALRAQVDTDLELTQLGRAVELINHEFSSSIKTVRRNLRALRPWGQRNEKLGSIERELATAFEHLDNYLTLFTPLQRRLYRKPANIRGAQVAQFISDLFGERFRRHSVDLQVSSEFEAFSFVGYPSTFYPVFVNLVDNAIFWLSDRPTPRIIRLSQRNGSLLVEDNGPGISLRDREAIFEHGFSRKPGGRGLGLKISRDVLQRSGWSLDVVPDGGLPWPDAAASLPVSGGRGVGACFSINPPSENEEHKLGEAE